MNTDHLMRTTKVLWTGTLASEFYMPYLLTADLEIFFPDFFNLIDDFSTEGLIKYNGVYHRGVVKHAKFNVSNNIEATHMLGCSMVLTLTSDRPSDQEIQFCVEKITDNYMSGTYQARPMDRGRFELFKTNRTLFSDPLKRGECIIS